MSDAIGIRCPVCGAEMAVHRTTPRPGFVLRRRECTACGKRETTAERIISEAPPSATAISDGLAVASIRQIAESAVLLLKVHGLATNLPHNAAAQGEGKP